MYSSMMQSCRMKKESAGQQWISQPVSRPTPESKMKVATALSESSFSSLKCGCDQAGIPSCIPVTVSSRISQRDVTPADGLHMRSVECMCANTRFIDYQLGQYHRSGMVGDGGQSQEKSAHPSVRYRVEKGAAHEC